MSEHQCTAEEGGCCCEVEAISHLDQQCERFGGPQGAPMCNELADHLHRMGLATMSKKLSDKFIQELDKYNCALRGEIRAKSEDSAVTERVLRIRAVYERVELEKYKTDLDLERCTYQSALINYDVAFHAAVSEIKDRDSTSKAILRKYKARKEDCKKMFMTHLDKMAAIRSARRVHWEEHRNLLLQMMAANLQQGKKQKISAIHQAPLEPRWKE